MFVLQGMDGMVKHPSTRKEQAYVIALGGVSLPCTEMKEWGPVIGVVEAVHARLMVLMSLGHLHAWLPMLKLPIVGCCTSSSGFMQSPKNRHPVCRL